MDGRSYGLSLLNCYSDSEDDSDLEIVQPSESSESGDDSCVSQSVVAEDLNEVLRALQLNEKSNMLKQLGIFNLSPVEDLNITVPEEECITVGIVHKIVEPLVVVLAKKGCPAIDLDSVLFLNNGKQILGQVFDVFGNVSEPMYMVRFNSLEDIRRQGIETGMEVSFAPRTMFTSFVFIDRLFQQKGSDASWERDEEPPEGCLDYSDDEEERRAKAVALKRRR